MTIPSPLPPTRPSWVQGMRPVKEGDLHPLAWQELLFRRATGRWGIKSGQNTTSAETFLGFPEPMTYFYVGRCVPSFGSYPIAIGPSEEPECPGPFTTPFDTGALAKGEIIVTDPGVPHDETGTFVSQHTFVGDMYAEPMREWLGEAFDTPVDYTNGERPAFHAVAEVSLEKCGGDTRVWTWEGRIPARDYTTPPMEVRRIYFSRGTREPYVDWVDKTDLATNDEKREHIRELYRFSEEVDDAVAGMVDYLRKEIAP